jgi:predicted  nucleic acid-binding Zn-ribbon protein
MSEALNLFRLQKLDTQIDKITVNLDGIERVLNDDRRVKRAKKVLEKAETEAKQKRIELNQIEDKVEAQRIKHNTTQASLFSGKITNPKELQDLQMESEALKRYITQLEDEQLEVMIAHETAVEAQETAHKDLEQTRGTVAEEHASLRGDRTRLTEEMERLSIEKNAVLQSISTETLSLYNKLRKEKRGIAVATVSDGSCSVCGQALTPADLQAIRTSADFVFCPSCGRIVYGES